MAISNEVQKYAEQFREQSERMAKENAELRAQIASLTESVSALVAKRPKKTESAEKKSMTALPKIVGVNADVVKNITKCQEWAFKKFGANITTVEASVYARKDGTTVPAAKITLDNGCTMSVTAQRFGSF